MQFEIRAPKTRLFNGLLRKGSKFEKAFGEHVLFKCKVIVKNINSIQERNMKPNRQY